MFELDYDSDAAGRDASLILNLLPGMGRLSFSFESTIVP
jgi:hypothetical protein